MAKVLDSLQLPIKKNGTTAAETYVNNPKVIAGQFSASTAYAVGQYVFYNKKLYRFKAAHAAGAWNSAHVDEVTVASELVSHGTDITELKADFDKYFDESPNLVDPSTVTVGMVISSSGAENTSTQTDTSDYIEVEPGGYYSWKNLSYVCRYGADKSWIGRTSGTSQNNIHLASTVHYVRVCGKTDTAETWRFNKGSLVDKPYHKDAYLKNVDIKPQVDEIIVPMLHQTSESVEGLFENGRIALASGNLQNDSARLRTINYLPGKILTITAKSGYEFAMYGYQDDQYKGNWQRTRFSKTGTAMWFKTQQIPVGYDVKVVVRHASDTTAAIDPYTDRDCLLFYEYLFEIRENEQILDRVMFSQDINKIFSLTETPEWTGTAQTMTSAQVYTLFDALTESYPSYITKQYLGDDEWGNEMAVYKCSPIQPTASYTTKTPKIFINCGIHGYEHVPPIAVYLVLKAICEEWADYPSLNILRHEVELNILPVANPSGFNAYTRKNGNGIDLNRNFSAGFVAGDDPSATDYGGTTALSELETQYIYEWLNNNRDTDIVLDFHNFGAYDGTIDWITIKNRYQSHIARVLIQRMTHKLKNEYSWLPQGVDAYYGYTSGVLSYNGLVKDQASAFGIPYSYTFELPRSFWGTITDGASTEEEASMAPIHRKICCECLVNFLLVNLVQLERSYKLD